MKYFIVLAFTVLFFSSIGNDKVEKKQIDKFESTLGEIETNFLNDIVNEFDSYLSKKYNNENSYLCFKQYLTEISESDNPDFWKIGKDKLEKILTGNLFAKYDSIYPDLVWYNNGVIGVSFYRLGIGNSIAITGNKNQVLNIDSLINSIKTRPKLNEIEPSYFQIALESIMTKDSLIQNYLDARKTAGTISIRLIADGLLYSINPENEYFAKRIMIMEMND